MGNPRPRRRPPKRKAHSSFTPTQIFIIIATITATFFFLLNGIDTKNEAIENKLAKQCQDSCIDIIQANGNGTLYQGSLVSSAVDAMFHFRALPEEESTDSASQSETVQKSQPSSYRKHYDVGERDVKRPLHLPPLIEKLVGTVDTNARLNSPHLSTRKRVRPDKDEWNKSTEKGIIGHGKENAKRGEGMNDSVAKVAAAAAAAVLSESEQRGRSKLSMKSYNDEWEEALLWIASWGQNDESQTGKSKKSHTQNKRERRKRKQDKAKSQDYEILQILDRCIDSCIDRKGNLSFLEGDKGKRFTQKIREQHLQRISTASIFELRDTIISINLALRKIKSVCLVLSLGSWTKIFRGMFGVVISSMAVVCFRNASYWRKLHRYTNSLRLLLEEESDDTKIKNGRLPRKTRVKKLKRKKRDQREISNGSSQMKNLSTEQGTWDNKSDNESVSSMESLDYNKICDDRHKKRDKELQKTVCDVSGDQGSKDNATSSTSSITTDDADEEFRKVPVDMKVSSKHVFDKSGKKSAQCSRQKRGNNDSGSRKDVETAVVTTPPKYSRSKYLLTPSPDIPTPEQREQAHLQLLKFQRDRMQKYLKEQEANEMKIKQAKSTPLRNITTSGVLSPNSVSSLSPTRYNAHKTEQEGADVGKLVSDLLDEEEVLNKGEGLSELDGGNGVSSSKNQRVVALGDLLVGSYSFELASSPPTNPWKQNPQSQITENSACDETENDSNFGTDANFCLQASARSFSPAWNVSDEVTEKQRIW